MTESQQSKRGWFSTWREHRRTKRQQFIESDLHAHEQAREPRGIHRRSSGYENSATAAFFGGYGGDGGGCGGDGGGGGC